CPKAWKSRKPKTKRRRPSRCRPQWLQRRCNSRLLLRPLLHPLSPRRRRLPRSRSHPCCRRPSRRRCPSTN
ncbi:hypothetical protein FBR04_13520, partial [Betaproteobacteria bacterium PRO7]|nr:hypothetical protein [Betaproteobacteria bacterium PRO7]